MSSTISEQLLAGLSDFVASRLGLHYPRKRWGDLARRIVPAACSLGFKDADTCIEWLLSAQPTRDQLELLASHLTIGETYFFREKKSFDILESRILPELIGSRQDRERRLRIWSAGCSTGEEAYSLAILLSRMIDDLRNWNITILATDINPSSLAKAVRGEYGDWSFRGIPAWVKERYFTGNQEGKFEIAGAIREMVTFASLNLADDSFPSPRTNTNAMDIIFCRNVLMYFTPDQTKRVIEKFHHSLLDGGWLVVSPCETSHTLFSSFDSVMFQDTAMYRKDGGKKATAPSCTAASTTAIPVVPLPESAAKTAPLPLPPQQKAAPAAPPVREETKPRISPYEAALASYRQGEYGKATALLDGYLNATPAADVSPSYGAAAALMTEALANQGRFTAALEWSEKAVTADRLDPRPYYLQASIFQEQGIIDAAAVSLKKALYLDHDFVLAHFALANLSLRQGRKTEAARYLDNAASLLRGYGDDDILPGSDGMSARRLAEIIAATRDSI